MTTVNVHEAKTRLSQLLVAVEAGEEVVIARGGRPVARLVGLERAAPQRHLGLLAGRFKVPADFDAPLPDDLQALFEGR